jgi:hypothetical protein
MIHYVYELNMKIGAASKDRNSPLLNVPKFQYFLRMHAIFDVHIYIDFRVDLSGRSLLSKFRGPFALDPDFVVNCLSTIAISRSCDLRHGQEETPEFSTAQRGFQTK